MLADDQLDQLAGRFHGGGELAGLALKFRRLLCAVRDDDRRMQPVEVADRAQRRDHVVGESDI